MADRYPLVYNPSANQLQELQSGDSLDIGNASLKNVAAFVGVLTATSFSGDGSSLTNLPAGATPTLDAVTTQGSTTTNSISVGGVTATGSISAATATFTGSISVGGTITYEDVTNVDSVGVVTARTGLKVLAGGANIVGATTATSFVKSGGTSSQFLKADGSSDGTTYLSSETFTAVGIQSAGTSIGNATTLNFIGVGNTFAVNGNTIDVSIQGSAGGSGGGGGGALDITSCLFI